MIMIDWAVDSDENSMTTFRMDDRLGRWLGPDFDDYCFPMDARVHDRSDWA